MAMSYKGGVISATAPTTSAGGAPGSWTLKQQMQAIGSSLWTGIPDAYYKYVTLLLPGNGTNGAQNNTFLDSSSNNFTITRNGNTTQGTFTPYGANWGNYFSGGYLTFTGTSAVNLYAAQFTFECWVYKTSTGLAQHIYGYNNATFDFWDIYIDTSERVVFRYNGNSANITTTQTVPLAQWTHIAVTYDGTTSRVFINGLLAGSAASGIVTANGNYTANIGINLYTGGVSPFYGYMSNIRIIKGSALYTANFTPPTAALTAVSGTSLLTCQSNRFIDNSTNAYALTATNSPSVQRFSPFSPTTYYAPDAVGGSGYFDGSGDYLTAPSNAAFNFGTGDFTVECWVYVTSYTGPATDVIASTYQDATNGWTIGIQNSVFYGAAAGDTAQINSTVAPSTQWIHLVFVRSGTTLAFFVNGVRSGTLTNSTNISSTSALTIGTNVGGGALNFNGYMSGLRIVKGTAVYDPTQSTLTVPTAPLTAITNTSLLLSGTNAAIIDNAMMNDLETVGNAQTSTTQSKWGGSSMYFDGTGDWLLARTSPNLDMGTGDLTVEGWFYLTATVAVDYRMIVSDATNGNNYICIRSGGTGGQLEVNVNGTSFRLNLNNSVTINTWFHLAVTRSGSTWYGFVNGVSLGTSTSSAAFNLGNGGMYVGRFGGVTAYEWPGYIDDLRITKGYARYTATFTPPAGPFTPN